MSPIILFGYPGTGKTYVGKIFEKYFEYYFYEGDLDLTPKMHQYVKEKKVFTDEMRDEFFEILIDKIEDLSVKHEKLVVAQTFIKEKYRLKLLAKIPKTKFILIETNEPIREKRLGLRKEYPLNLEYAQKMVVNFEMPKIKHLIINNDHSGEEDLLKQIKLLDL